METLSVVSLEERSIKGQEIYVDSMEKSVGDKEKLLPFVKPGIIVDAGAGAGPFTQKLIETFPESRVLAVDFSGDMCDRLAKRLNGENRVEIIRSDVRHLSYPEKVDTIVHISNLHEVFSENNYDHLAVADTLANDRSLLNSGGRLIIRDGVQPEEEEVYVKPLNYSSYSRFFKFIEGFEKVRKVPYQFGKFYGDRFSPIAPKSFGDLDRKGLVVRLHSQNASELFSKYFYPEENLSVELTEQFGIWTLKEYSKILELSGFKIIHSESYVLPYLLENHYKKDFEVYKLGVNGLEKTTYPPSTMVLVGEKI